VSGGGSAFTLTVTGAGFVNGAMAQWNGANRTTNFVSNTQLTAQIPASDLMTLGPATITVFNPASSGGGGRRGFQRAELQRDRLGQQHLGGELAAGRNWRRIRLSPRSAASWRRRTLRARRSCPCRPRSPGRPCGSADSAGAELLTALFFVAPSQVNYLMPAGAAAGRATVTITSGAIRFGDGPLRRLAD
jgi:hypothetical protein